MIMIYLFSTIFARGGAQMSKKKKAQVMELRNKLLQYCSEQDSCLLEILNVTKPEKILRNLIFLKFCKEYTGFHVVNAFVEVGIRGLENILYHEAQRYVTKKPNKSIVASFLVQYKADFDKTFRSSREIILFMGSVGAIKDALSIIQELDNAPKKCKKHKK